jgi:hypothetical protein
VNTRGFLVVLLVLLVIGIVLALGWFSRRSVSAQSSAKNPYLGLREQALHFSREKVGIPAPTNKADAWGVLMDWGVQSGTATVVAMADGSASIYLSSGGGSIGGIGKEPIREAAKRAVAAAVQAKSSAHPTATYPLPHTGEVFFYFLTDDGVFTASASE